METPGSCAAGEAGGRPLPASRWGRGLAVGTLLAVLFVGCGQADVLSPDDPIFEGLPRRAVVETLSLPRIQRDLQGESIEQQRSFAQAAVRTLISCREALRVYLTWIRSGVPPEVSPGPVPVNPIEPGNAAVEEDYVRLKAAVASGDPDRLRGMLLAEGGCGPNWPAEPGGPTIAEVVREQGA